MVTPERIRSVIKYLKDHCWERDPHRMCIGFTHHNMYKAWAYLLSLEIVHSILIADSDRTEMASQILNRGTNYPQYFRVSFAILPGFAEDLFVNLLGPITDEIGTAP